MYRIFVSITLIICALNLSAQSNSIEKVVYECNFDCPSCKDKVMKNIIYEKGIKNVVVEYEEKLVTIDYKQGKNNPDNLKSALEKLGYEVDYKGKAINFEVKGNCGMCKTRIENAANSVKGVSSASWNNKSQTITVAFDNRLTSANAIKKAIAKAGHDTDTHKSDDKTYANLHHCCKYDR